MDTVPSTRGKTTPARLALLFVWLALAAGFVYLNFRYRWPGVRSPVGDKPIHAAVRAGDVGRVTAQDTRLRCGQDTAGSSP